MIDSYEIVDMDVDDLIPYENNPRDNDDAVDPVAESIKTFGFKQPIVVDADNVVVVGHTRLKAAKKLGLKTVPVIVADDLTPQQARAYRLVDNKSGEFSEWNKDKLDFEYARLIQTGEVDMSAYSFDVDVDAVLARIDQAQREQNLNDCEEFDIENFDEENFAHTCPECGFKFN